VRKLAFAVPFVAALLAFGPANADETFKAMEKEAFDKAVRTYILEHPEVIIEALEKYEAQERNAQEKAAAAALIAQKDKLFEHPMTPISGNRKGDVTVVEFFDYQCGFCKRTLSTVLEVLDSDKQVKVVWKELPILGPASEFAARAAMASNKQGKYQQYHVAIMSARGRLTPEKVLRLASKVGLDVDQLKRDMEDPTITAYLQETLQLAQTLGINGTPGFVIGNKLIPGAIDKSRMQELIAAARNQS
jgi:protein-disulfide isomerase